MRSARRKGIERSGSTSGLRRSAARARRPGEMCWRGRALECRCWPTRLPWWAGTPPGIPKGGMLMKIGQALVEQDAALAGEAKTWENIDSRERRAAI